MPSCAVCTHDQRKAIEADLASGKPQRDVARRWRITAAGVNRHMLRHLRPAIVNGLAKREYRAADDALALRDRAMKWLDGCQTAISDAIAGRKANGDPLSYDDVAGANEKLKQVPAMIGRVKDCIDLIGRISGEVPTGSQVTVNFFQKLGVESEAHLRELLAFGRATKERGDVDEHEAAHAAAEWLARYFIANPDKRFALLATLGAGESGPILSPAHGAESHQPALNGHTR